MSYIYRIGTVVIALTLVIAIMFVAAVCVTAVAMIKPRILVAVWTLAIIGARRAAIVARVIDSAIRIDDLTIAVNDAAVGGPPHDLIRGSLLVFVIIVEDDRRYRGDAAENDVSRARLSGGLGHRWANRGHRERSHQGDRDQQRGDGKPSGG